MKTNAPAFCFAALLAMSPLAALAHGDHDQPPRVMEDTITEEKAKEIASREAARLVEAKKLPKSWLDAEMKGAEKRRTKKSFEWRVSLANPNGEAKKKTLYVFVKATGEVSGTNFTGK